MAAKAAAGSKKVKIRGGAMFSRNDLDQLTNHEAFVHTTTVLNGKKQPLLTSMALSAPRTTKTQEGLATFSELATYSMDMNRLRRIALRVNAVQAALDGADFVDLFRFFLDAGQSLEESYQSAQRVLRGGDPAGGAAFTKDAVYLEGLALVHTFLTKAIADNRPGLIPDLFAGRLTLGDVVSLQPLFDDGHSWPNLATCPRGPKASIASRPTSPSPPSPTGSGWSGSNWRGSPCWRTSREGAETPFWRHLARSWRV